jgi:hypothetical protein
MENNQFDVRPNLIDIICPFCSHQIQGIPHGGEGEIKCLECNNMFHFPNLTHEERQIVALMTINDSIRGISNTIWLVFFTIPLIGGAILGFLFSLA